MILLAFEKFQGKQMERERERERERETLRRIEEAARQARFMADRRDFSLEGAWYPAPTCTATKNLGLSSFASQAIGFGFPSVYWTLKERERERERESKQYQWERRRRR